MTDIKPGHYVLIVHNETDVTEKTLGPYASERQAERAENGVLRNISHHYHTKVEEVR